jgi:SAM-dependent methyltransferase
MDARLAHHANLDVSGYDDNPHHPRIAELLISGMPVAKPPALLVDVATGTGFAAYAALRALGPERVLAVDISSAMIGQARRKAADLDPSGVITWRLGTAVPLDLADASADAVTCASAMHFLGAAAVREFRRVLRPGGQLAFSIPSGVDLRPSPELRREMPADLTLPQDEEQAARLATDAGFVDAHVVLTAPSTPERPRRSFLVYAKAPSERGPGGA